MIGKSMARAKRSQSASETWASGRSTIQIDGDLPRGRGPTEVELGRVVRLEAKAEETRLDRPDRSREDALGAEEFVLDPGVFQLRPGALGDQCEHHDIALHVAPQMPQQAGLADTGASKETNPLTAHDRQQRVEHRHARLPVPRR